MGFISNLFGGSKETKALRDALAEVRRLIEDERYQLEVLPPEIRAMFESGSDYDCDPNGSGEFGYADTNPVPVNGSIGQLAYLSKLETTQGERILFHRIGAINTIDVFEAVTYSGSEWFILFLDCYHPRRSRLVPDGFRFIQALGQFSGFHQRCNDFPYDFVEMKHTQSESGLSMAYIPIANVRAGIENRVYSRPLAHKAKLDLIAGRLTSFQEQ